MPQTSYFAMRTDPQLPDMIMREIRGGRLRQGWGHEAEQDLREIEKIWSWHGGAWTKLSEGQQLAAGHFAFLGRDEPGMMRAGDIILVPKLPTPDRFVLCRLLEGEYEFIKRQDTGDHGHIRPVELLTSEGVVKNAAAVEAPLQRTLRTRSRLWSLSRYAPEIA